MALARAASTQVNKLMYGNIFQFVFPSVFRQKIVATKNWTEKDKNKHTAKTKMREMMEKEAIQVTTFG